MPRHARIHAPGSLYHMMARGNNGQAVFLTPADYEAFLAALQTTRERYPFSLYAYVLMPNHFHLLLEVELAPTGRVMQALLTGYARRFNRVHHRRGHVFQGRYKAIVCERERYLSALVRYIHLNPVRAGLVKRPRDWQWSGHGEYLGTVKRGGSLIQAPCEGSCQPRPGTRRLSARASRGDIGRSGTRVRAPLFWGQSSL